MIFQEKDQRSMDIDTAKEMLRLLLGKNWPLFPSFHQFLEEHVSQWHMESSYEMVMFMILSPSFIV